MLHRTEIYHCISNVKRSKFWVTKFFLLGAILPSCVDSSIPSEKAKPWVIDSHQEWLTQINPNDDILIENGFVSSSKKTGVLRSKIMSNDVKRSVKSITIKQSPSWQNWNRVEHLGPQNMADAPILLRRGEGDYWVFARYNEKLDEDYVRGKERVSLAGYDEPIYKTQFENQYDALGGLKPSLGGYHAWQSHDMENWVHHGPVSDYKARWMTTAEQVGGKTHFYYDFPNDQDPHLIIDNNLTDGKVGLDMGLAFRDPSDGSDSAVIRDLDGKFHLILEDWSPIEAMNRSWDSPLASHAVSEDGISNFKLVDPAVDYRTEPTGEFSEYPHPHWYQEDPDNFPGKAAPDDIPEHLIKKGDVKAFAKYEIYSPEQPAFGDWAAIAVGGQYYLFGDYDPVGLHGREHMEIAWLTSSDINEPFVLQGTIGQGHPDPDIMFAEDRFYLISQVDDFVSPGPWVDGVEVRVGVDIDNDNTVDKWSNWARIYESYSSIDGFSKQVAKTPAQKSLSDLPTGYGFQFEVRLTDITENSSKPIIDQITLDFAH